MKLIFSYCVPYTIFSESNSKACIAKKLALKMFAASASAK